jgi:carboxypeptidase Taq
MNGAQQAYDSLTRHTRETALLGGIESLLGWDERTMLPTEAGEYRAEQLTLLAGMLHARRTDRRIGDWLAELAESRLAADPHSDAGATVRQLRRQYEKQIKLPQSLVEELARTTSLAQHAWEQARPKNDYKSFAPFVKKIFELKRAQADALGFEQTRYDALLDDFEPGAKTADVAGVLRGLREALVPLVAEIADSSRRPNLEILKRRYCVDAQEKFGREAAARIGFEFSRGRLDVTSHPFCSGMGPSDCRITPRFDEHFFPTAFFGILHEAGHGLYELGLRRDVYGLPPGEAVSLGVHESQSRLWENLVGRSRAFWDCFYGPAQQSFSESLGSVPFEEFFFAINDVRPSLIRVEADEATYNLHILIRFELEQELLSDNLPVDDLPSAWHNRYRQYLGVASETDRDGVMQDIHWSAGLVGYFPTYSLGNLYASQLFEKAEAELGSLEAMFRRGEFSPLLAWLRKNIHAIGQRYDAADLIQRVTGQPISHEPLMRHLRGKLGPLYGLKA